MLSMDRWLRYIAGTLDDIDPTPDDYGTEGDQPCPPKQNGHALNQAARRWLNLGNTARSIYAAFQRIGHPPAGGGTMHSGDD